MLFSRGKQNHFSGQIIPDRLRMTYYGNVLIIWIEHVEVGASGRSSYLTASSQLTLATDAIKISGGNPVSRSLMFLLCHSQAGLSLVQLIVTSLFHVPWLSLLPVVATEQIPCLVVCSGLHSKPIMLSSLKCHRNVPAVGCEKQVHKVWRLYNDIIIHTSSFPCPAKRLARKVCH